GWDRTRRGSINQAVGGSRPSSGEKTSTLADGFDVTRHYRVVLSLLLAVPVWALAAEPRPGATGDPQPPSLLLITLDTTRPDHLQPYGSDVETPTLAALASEGIVFEQAYSVAPIT